MALSLVYFEGAMRGFLIAPGDAINEFYPLRRLMGDMLKEGSLPLWNPYMFAGFPQAASMQPGVLYPVNIILSLVFPAPTAFNAGVMFHAAVAGFFTYLYAASIGARPIAAASSGIAFGFMGIMASHIIHTPIQSTAAWLPAVLYFLERTRRNPSLRDCILASFIIGLQVYAGHPQTVMQCNMLYALYIVFHGIGRPRFLWMGALGILFGLILAAPQLYALYELSGLALRAKLTYEQFSQFSFPFHMLPSMVLPFLWGKGYGGPYWGPEGLLKVSEGFIGLLPALLFVAVAIKMRKSRHVLFWALVLTVFFLLALGDNFPLLHRLMHRAPAYNSFRAPVRNFLQADFALSVFLAFGISMLIEKDRGFVRGFFWILGAAACLTFAAGLIMPVLFQPGISSSAFYVPFVFMLSYIAVVFFSEGRAGSRRFVGAAFAVLIFFEALSFSALHRGAWPKISDVRAKEGSGVYSLLAGRTERAAFVFPSEGAGTQNMLPVGSKIRLLNAYDPLILKDLSDLLDMEGIGYSHSWNDLLSYNSILSMLGTAYVFVPAEMSPFVESVRGKAVKDKGETVHFEAPIGAGLPDAAPFERVYEKVLESEEGVLYANRNSMPPAYPVEGLMETRGAADTKRLFYAFRADPRRHALLNKEDISLIGRRKFGKGAVEMLKRDAHTVTLGVDFADAGFVVLAEQFYPGWKAFVDGRETAIYRANGALMGIVVPGGSKMVVFKYKPAALYALLLTSGAFFIVMAFVCFRPKGPRPQRP